MYFFFYNAAYYYLIYDESRKTINVQLPITVEKLLN